jgi:putrescine aminotransferase
LRLAKVIEGRTRAQRSGARNRNQRFHQAEAVDYDYAHEHARDVHAQGSFLLLLQRSIDHSASKTDAPALRARETFLRRQNSDKESAPRRSIMPVTNAQVYDDFAAHVSPGKVQFYRANGLEFAIGRREGPFVWDVEGKRRLINCHVNGGTYNLGHRNPELVAALTQAVQELDIGNHHLPSAARARLARRLAETSPGGRLPSVVFGVGGGEAIDLAIKVARRHTGRRKIVSYTLGYHGHTGLAIGTGHVKYPEYFLCTSADNVRVPFNDLAALRASLESDVAAVILETIPATAGMPIPQPDYLPGVKELCAANGTLFIADEVQTGLGRTGHLWGVEAFDVIPDLLVTAKGLSGGLYPISATLMTADCAHVFDEDPFAHVSTMGGAELGCIVAEKVVDICSAPAFLARVRQLSERFASGLRDIRERHPDSLREIRRCGMFMGLKFGHDYGGVIMMKTCFDAGILAWVAGNDRSVLQFLPPLNIDVGLADEILERLDTAVAHYGRLTTG